MKSAATAGVTLVLALCLVLLVPASALGDDGGKVVVTRPGVVFHLVGSSDVRGRGVEKAVSEALAQGYTPCRVCFASHAASASLAPAARGGAAAASFGSASTAAVGIGSTSASSSASRGDGVSYRPPTPVEKGGTWDPYLDPRTIVFPGIEQKAY